VLFERSPYFCSQQSMYQTIILLWGLCTIEGSTDCHGCLHESLSSHLQTNQSECSWFLLSGIWRPYLVWALICGAQNNIYFGLFENVVSLTITPVSSPSEVLSGWKTNFTIPLFNFNRSCTAGLSTWPRECQLKTTNTHHAHIVPLYSPVVLRQTVNLICSLR
jgi:hypothetical protein